MERKNGDQADKFKAWRAAVLADSWQRARKILAETPEDQEDKDEDEREDREERELYEEEWEEGQEEKEKPQYPIVITAERAARKEKRRLEKIERQLPCGHTMTLSSILAGFADFAQHAGYPPHCSGCVIEFLKFPMATPSKTGFFLDVLVIGKDLNYDPRRFIFYAEPFHTIDKVRRNLHWHESLYKDWYNIRFYGPPDNLELDEPNQTLEKAGINKKNAHLLIAYRFPLDASKPGYTVPVKKKKSMAYVKPF